MAPRGLPLVVLIVAALLAPAESAANPPATAEDAAASAARLKPFASCKGLIRYGRSHVGTGPGAWSPPGSSFPRPLTGLPLQEDLGVPPTVPRSLPVAEDDSGTNVQERGVDEPDLVKAADGRIFVVAAGKLHAVAAGGLELLGSLELDGWGHQLLLRGQRLLVIAQSAPLGSAQTRVAPGLMDEVTELSEVDVSDPAAMRIVRTERIRGSHLSSRLSGATARIVVWTRPRALLEPAFRSRLRGWLPRRVSRRARGGRPVARRAAPCREVLRPALYSGIDVLTVLTVDLAKGLPAVDSDAIMAGGQTVYASPSALYVGTPEWAPEPESADMPPERALTTVHKFGASEPDRTHYRASGRLPGYLLNQFSLSEHEGVLRAASTDSPVWWSGRDRREPESFVTTLAERDGRLVQLGQVGGLGRGEQIHAVRFLEERGYVVTFRQVDPLYTVDLSSPGRPRVAGELKIRGYSAYLHPLADDLLLGVGQDATEGGATLGTQLSLFDVSDPARPARLFQHAIADASSEAEWDHHAFLFWSPQKLAVLPLTSYGPGARSFSGAAGFTVDRAAGIAEAGRAEHSADVRRSLVLDGQLFTISDAGIEANSMPGLAEQAHLAFP